MVDCMKPLKHCTRFEDRHWYSPSLTWLSLLLLPLTWLFALITALRRSAYRFGLLKTFRASVPVIVVGNINVGGVGKTPCVIAMAEYLKSQGLVVGIVSRGVGSARNQQPHLVTQTSTAAEVGDEALLMSRRSQVPVVIGKQRVAAVQHLLAHYPQCSVILSDDGLQHYALKRDIEILVVDGERGFGNGCLLPAGPLRESVKRMATVDFVVTNGQAKLTSYGMDYAVDGLRSVLSGVMCRNIDEIKQQPVHAVAGIGNPGRFFTMLRQQGFTVIEHVFPDHYAYQSSDFGFADTLPIIMTEKDAVKCDAFANERMWVMPITAKLDVNFLNKLTLKLRGIKS